MEVAAQRAANRAMTGTWDNRCYVNSFWYRSNMIVDFTYIKNLCFMCSLCYV